jgi:hypothetical protein
MLATTTLYTAAGVATRQARSARFDDAVTGGGRTITRVDLLRGGVVIAPNLPIRGDGHVTVDGTAEIRRTLAVTVVDETGLLTPRKAVDPLAPYGNELAVSAGFIWPDGTSELVSLGVFRVTKAQTHRQAVDIVGADRAVVIRDASHEQPYVIPAGTNLITAGAPPAGALFTLLDTKFPGLTYRVTSSTFTVPLTVYEEGNRAGNPMANAMDLAAKGGLEVFFDAEGVVVIRLVPNLVTDPIAWTYAPGTASIKLAAENTLDVDDAGNVAVVTGEGTGLTVPIRSVAAITDPANPLYPGSSTTIGIGRRPVFVTSPLILSQAQCDIAAAALLRRIAGGSEIATLTAAPHPAHDAGDIVTITDPIFNGGSADAVLSRFTMPISLRGTVTYATLARRSA